jgi:hypothetical protein
LNAAAKEAARHDRSRIRAVDGSVQPDRRARRIAHRLPVNQTTLRVPLMVTKESTFSTLVEKIVDLMFR